MLSAKDYVKKAIEFAKLMKWIDPTIQLVSCGQTGNEDWDRIVLNGLAPYVDYHSIHIYTGSYDYYSNVFEPHQTERALRNCQALIDNVRYVQHIDHPIFIAYDEWNVWFKERGPETGLEERYTLADMLAVSTYLNSFIRHCRTVKIANIAQLVNVIAPIFTSPEGMFLQTIYHPLRLFREYMLGTALDVLVDGPTYDLQHEEGTYHVKDLGPFQLLDVSATWQPSEHQLVLAVVNRDHDQHHAASIVLADNMTIAHGTAYEVNGAQVETVNSFENPHAVDVAERHIVISGDGALEHSFAPHSLTILRLQLA
jgi:alpha-N-arabinofuranosidase